MKTKASNSSQPAQVKTKKTSTAKRADVTVKLSLMLTTFVSVEVQMIGGCLIIVATTFTSTLYDWLMVLTQLAKQKLAY